MFVSSNYPGQDVLDVCIAEYAKTVSVFDINDVIANVVSSLNKKGKRMPEETAIYTALKSDGAGNAIEMTGLGHEVAVFAQTDTPGQAALVRGPWIFRKGGEGGTCELQAALIVW